MTNFNNLLADLKTRIDPKDHDFPVYITGDGGLAKLAALGARSYVYMNKPLRSHGVTADDCVHQNVSLQPANKAAIELLLNDKREYATQGEGVYAAPGPDGNLYITKIDDGWGLKVGDPVPEEWGVVAITDEAKADDSENWDALGALF